MFLPIMDVVNLCSRLTNGCATGSEFLDEQILRLRLSYLDRSDGPRGLD